MLSLLASAGLPFFLLSANAPLIQSWFADSGHPQAANPYFLYSASNLGSFLALIGYPFLVERFLGTDLQLTLWSWGYGLFVVLIGVIGLRLLRRGVRTAPVSASAGTADDDDGPAPGLRDRVYWMALAFVPSSLLLGVTQYLTTDIAAFPLLWVIPLSLYLLTFVIAFSRFNDFLLKYTLNLQIFLLFAAVFTLALEITNTQVMLLHLAAFFVIAYVCHGQLAASRPRARYLTEFYLWLSVGGVLGGIFNALAAPLLFTGVWEYPIALLAAALMRPAVRGTSVGGTTITRPGMRHLAWALALGAVGFGIFWFAADYGLNSEHFSAVMSSAFVVLFGLMFILGRKYPLRLFAMMTATVLSAGVVTGTGNILFKERNFFGTLMVYHNASLNVNEMVHGTTLHGLQSLEPERRFAPTTYYKPLEDIFALADRRAGQAPVAPVALVGLGVGTVVCLGRPGQAFDIYEINPAVVRAARNPDLFSYLSGCPAKDQIRVILGDARLSMAGAEDRKYGLMILDAYNSDALPVHLLTREALALYLKKLRPNGLLALHISNNYLDLKPVVQALARDLGLEAALRTDEGDGELQSPSEWIVLSRKMQTGSLTERLPESWGLLSDTTTTTRVWTDNYSNIIGSLK